MDSGARLWPRVWAYLGFGMTGVALVAPGVLLPAMERTWHLNDSGAGVLLLMTAAGSALGSMIALRSFALRLFTGSLLVSFAAALWALSHLPPSLPALLWGIGLGLMMTTISLAQQQTAAGTGLIRLNFLWSLGAFACAPMMTRALRLSRPDGVLLGFAATFLLYAAGALRLFADPLWAAPRRTSGRRVAPLSLAGIPFTLVLATALSTGIEASCGGWLSTYASRQHSGLLLTVGAPTCLWAGLLASRALSWLPNLRPTVYGNLREHTLLTAAAALAIVVWPVPAVLLLGAFCIGAGLGPLYPLLLDRVLKRRENNAIFLSAGIGSSVLPWLTGLVSSSTHSLRLGFVVILCASGVLMAAALPHQGETEPATTR